MDNNNSKIFTFLLTIFYILGLVAVFYNYQLVLAFFVLAVIVFLILFYNLGFRKALFLYLIFFLGFIRAKTTIIDHIEQININNSVVVAKVVSSKNVSNDKVKFYVKPLETRVYNNKLNDIDSKILVSIPYDKNIEKSVKIGSIIEVQGKLRTPFSSSNPYEFDYKKYLLNNDCKYILYGNNYKVIREVDKKTDKWLFVLSKFESKRNRIIETHAKNIKSPKLEILGGIVFGNETINPTEEIKESFRNSGLIHLLAASGLNVALIFGIWWWIANLLKLPYHLSILTGALFVVFYTFMTGFPPSILRASLMLLFVLFGKLIDRKADSVALIFFVAFLILLACPKMLFDIGFQLSFAVTFGLISSVDIIVSKFSSLDKKFSEKYKNLSRMQKYFVFLLSPKALVSIAAVPLVAQIWVIPLQTHYFNTFTPFSLFANILVVPFIGILSFLGFVSSIIALCPFISAKLVFLFDSIANPLLAILIKISLMFSSFKTSLITVAGFNLFQIFSFWGLALLFIYNLEKNFKNKKIFIAFCLLFLVFLLSFARINHLQRNLEIIMFDAGNADSFLIKTPKNRYILIDTGRKVYNSYSQAQTIINRYLINKRINSLYGLIVTHFDIDHAGGTIDILKQIKHTQCVYLQKEGDSSKVSKEIVDYLKENKINYETIEESKTIYKEKDLEVKVFKPDIKNLKNIDQKENETSIITLVAYKGKNILFMGDSGVLGFEKIEPLLPSRIDIIKIGHHGAKNTINKKMIDRLNPKYALISTGFNNFSHPHYSTISLLNKENIKILSTKDYGFIKIVINKKTKFYHFDSETKKITPVLFDKNPELPFNKQKFTQDLINKHL